jgi:hypothetical protein
MIKGYSRASRATVELGVELMVKQGGILMAEFESQNTAQSAPAPADPGYAQVSEFRDTNTIPHHHAVESEEDGKRHGRIYYGPRVAVTQAA